MSEAEHIREEVFFEPCSALLLTSWENNSVFETVTVLCLIGCCSKEIR